MASGHPIVRFVFGAVVFVSMPTPAAVEQAAPSSRTEALIVLRGFGYSRDGARALKALEPAVNAAGFDFFVPDYLSRGGIDKSRAKLQQFLAAPGMAQYQRLHVFAFLAGAWTFNPLVNAGEVPKIATVISDRSPYQERAARIADEKLHLLTWVRYGSPVFDVARTPYPPLTASGVKVGLLVETLPTSFIRDHNEKARSYGPFQFDCDSFAQRHDDCMFVELSHDELYVRFGDVLPEVLSFIRNGRFSGAAYRIPPKREALAAPIKK